MEQLADGLHLIDFEQLKIENQTLNEKIEERNEELFKLRSKIEEQVIMVTHTRERYYHLMKVHAKNQEKHQVLFDRLSNLKKRQTALKKEREDHQAINQRLKQETGVENKRELKQDYFNRVELIEKLDQENKMLADKHARLTRVINKATEIQMRKAAGT